MPSKFDAVFEQMDKQRAQVTGAKIAESPADPDKTASAVQVAKDLGVSPLAVDADPAHYKQLHEQKRATEALQSAPKTTGWVANPVNAALAKDDLPTIGWFEGMANSFVRFGYYKGQAVNQFQAEQSSRRGADQGKSFGEIVYDSREPILDADGKEVGRYLPDVADTAEAAYRWLDSRISNVLGTDETEVAASFQQSAAAWARDAQAIPMTARAEKVKEKIGAFDASKPIGEQLAEFGRIVAEDPVGFTSFLSQTLGESLPDMVASAAVLALTRNPRAAAMTQGIVSGGNEALREPLSELQEAKFDLTKDSDRAAAEAQLSARFPDAAEQGRAVFEEIASGAYDLKTEEGLEALMTAMSEKLGADIGDLEGVRVALRMLKDGGRDLTIADVALATVQDRQLMRAAADKGITRGIVIGAVDALSGLAAGSELSGSALRNFAGQAALQAVMGGAGEGLAQLATGDEINVAEIAVEALAEFVTAPIEVASMGGGKLGRMISRSQKAGETAKQLEQLDQMAGQSKLKARAPDKFLEALTAQGLDQTDIMIAPEPLREYFQGLGYVDEVDAELLASFGLTQEAWDMAQASGSDVGIPASHYAAKLSGTPAAQVVLQHGRFGPDDEMSLAEAEEFNLQMREIMERELDELAKLQEEDDRQRSSLQIIRDELGQQLRAAGHVSGVAEAETALWVSTFENAGRLSGMDPLALWERYRVKVFGAAQDDVVRRRNVLDSDINTLRKIGRKAGASPRQMVKEARKAALEKYPELKSKRPFTSVITNRGGVAPTMVVEGQRVPTPAAAELASRGITPKNSPMLFRKGGMTDLDNIVAAEVFASPVLEEDGNGYISRDAVIDALEREARGEKIPYSAEALASMTELDNMEAALGDDADLPTQGGYMASVDQADVRLSQLAGLLDERDLDLDAMSNDEIAELLGLGQSIGTSFAAGEAGLVLNQFAGKSAINADLHQMSTAKAAIEAGADPETIRRQTGWFRGTDGEWRFEISDADAELTIAGEDGSVPTGPFELMDILKHDRLYAAYPDLGTMSVRIADDVQANGLYSPDTDSISLKAGRSAEEILSTLLHEIQHALQSREGFARGGSLSEARSTAVRDGLSKQAAWYEKKLKEARAWYSAQEARQKAVVRDALIYKTVEDLNRWAGSENIGRYALHIRRAADWLNVKEFSENSDLRMASQKARYGMFDIPRAAGPERDAALREYALELSQLISEALPPDTLASFRSDERASEEILEDAKIEELAFRDEFSQVEEAEGKAVRSKRVAEIHQRSDAYAIYRAIAGEAEARNVQARQNMSDEERRRVSPADTLDVSQDGLIVINARSELQAPVMMNADPSPRELFQTKEAAPKGSVRFPERFGKGDTIVNLFETADLSTFLHESGHVFLEMYQDLANAEELPSPEIQQMMKTLRDWMGVEDGKPIERQHHEKFARGFEAYLMDGKAPSLELQDAFSRFKSWLVSIYKHISALRVRLSPEVRDVMSRMIASENAIAEAKQAYEIGPMFAERGPAGMSQHDWDVYQKFAKREVSEAEDKAMKAMMAKVKRETQAWYKAEKEAVTKQVQEEFASRRNFGAVSVMANKAWLDPTNQMAVPDIQLDRAELVEAFGEGILAELDRKRLGGGRNIFSKKGAEGLPLASAVELFGYSSSQEMVEELQNTPRLKDAIRSEVERRMVEAYGDPLSDGSIQEVALQALHNDTKVQRAGVELKTLARRAGKRDPRLRLIKARARILHGHMTLKDASNPSVYLRAEQKAAREAQAAFADVVRGGSKAKAALEAAYAAKEREILNHYLYVEARALADEMRKGRDRFRSYSSAKVRQAIGSPQIETIDGLLETYDFKRRTEKWVSNRESLKAYIDRMTEEGREGELSIDPVVAAQAQAKHYTRMTVDEFRGLLDTVKNIEAHGRLRDKLRTAQSERSFKATVEGVREAMAKNLKAKPRSREADPAFSRRRLGRDVLNWTLNADTLLREIDGRGDMGVAWTAIKADIDQGLSREMERRQQVAKRMEEISSVYSSAEKRAMSKKKPNAALGGDYSKWAVISMALNSGNADNWQRLTDPSVPGSFNEEQVNAALSQLDDRDWKFAQDMIDLINEFWPDISAKEKRMTGVAPKKVEPFVQTTAAPDWFLGGYYPIKYDREISGRADDLSQKEAADQMRGGRLSKAQTKNGHTKERKATAAQPLNLDIGVIVTHLNDVIHDLEMGEAVANSWRILGALKQDFYDFGRQSDYEALESWIRDVGAGDSMSAHGWGKIVRHMRSGFTMSRLALNLVTVALQPTGIAQTFVVLGKGSAMRGIASYMRNPSRWSSDVLKVSPFMRERQDTFQRDLHDVVGKMDVSGFTGGRYQTFMRKYAMPLSFWLMQKVQFYVVDMPTWVGAYQKEMRKLPKKATEAQVKAAEQKARAYADFIVKRAQGSGLIADRGMLERGKFKPNDDMGEMAKLFTTLGTFMFTRTNVAYERTMGVKWKNPLEVMSWVSDMVILFSLEALLGAVVRGSLPDDDEPWATWMLKETGLSMMGGIPFVRDAASGLQGFGSGGTAGSVLDLAVARPALEAASVWEDGEIDRRTLTTMLDSFGVWFHLPTAQINRTLKALLDEDLSRSDNGPVSLLGFGQGKGRTIVDVISGN